MKILLSLSQPLRKINLPFSTTFLVMLVVMAKYVQWGGSLPLREWEKFVFSPTCLHSFSHSFTHSPTHSSIAFEDEVFDFQLSIFGTMAMLSHEDNVQCIQKRDGRKTKYSEWKSTIGKGEGVRGSSNKTKSEKNKNR